VPVSPLATDPAPPAQTAPATLPPALPPLILATGEELQPGSLVLPTHLRRVDADAVVELTFRIDASGRVADFNVVSESPPGRGFPQALADSLMPLRFRAPANDTPAGPAAGVRTFLIQDGAVVRLFARPLTEALEEARRNRDNIRLQPRLIGGDPGRVFTFPLRARVNNIESGVAVVEFTILPDGSVRDVDLVQEEPTEQGFGYRALEGVRHLRFEPAIENGNRVESRARYRVCFLAR
jgi:TonB family protein